MVSPRVVEVAPPSKSGENGLVLRLALAVAFAMLFVISSRRRATAADELPLLPYQKRFADLPAPLQRDDRELREGFLEAARARVKDGQWPEPEKLAQDGVPPFANDGVDGRVRDWQRVQEGRLELYLGFARDGIERPALLLQVIESAPGDLESRDPSTPIDEEHQRLADGTLVHVTTWYRDGDAVASGGGGKFQPEMAGWTQMVGRARTRR
jgi:hypothetical protein